MKKILSICCVLALVLSVCSAAAIFPASAQTVKNVTGNVVLPGETTPTEITSFVYDDFEGYDTTNPLATGNWIPYVEGAATVPSTNTITTVSNFGSTGLNVKYARNTNDGGASIQETGIVPANWPAGNKLTHLSYDTSNFAQVNFMFLWPKELDVTGRQTGTSVADEFPLYSAVGVLHQNNAGSNVDTNFKIVKYPANSAGAWWKGTLSKFTSTVVTKTSPAHWEIDVKYTNISETSITAAYTVDIYEFLSSGDYSSAKSLLRMSDTYSLDLTGKSVNAYDISLMPMIVANGQYSMNISFDNIKVESTHSKAINFVNNYGELLESDSCTINELEPVASALASFDPATLYTLSYYTALYNEKLSSLEKVTTEDFENSFITANLWSNPNNFKVENGTVTGTNDGTVVSAANGVLSKDDALTAVSFDLEETRAGGWYNGAVLIPLYYQDTANSDNDVRSYFMVASDGTQNGVRLEPYDAAAGISVKNIVNGTTTSDYRSNLNLINNANVRVKKITILYDWSKFNEAGGYYVKYYIVCQSNKIDSETGEATGASVTDIGWINAQINATVAAKLKPTDFKFALKRVQRLDNVSFYSNNDLSGNPANKSAAIYFNSDDESDENNGAMVYRVSNNTIAPADFVAQVTNYGSVFISNGSLVNNGLTGNDLTLKTEKAFSVNKAALEAAGVTDGLYNVRINNTQTARWYNQNMVARTYVTYKFGNNNYITVYSDPYTISNLKVVKQLAASNSVTGSTFSELLNGLKNIKYPKQEG